MLANASQERTFTEAAHDLVENTLQGYNSTLFCYGQTGAGKTFTTSGNSSSYEQRGIVPRAIAHVFQEIDTRVDKIYTVRVSCLEIYNEQMYDLLAEDPSTADHLHCMEDNGTVVIKGLTKKLVRSSWFRAHYQVGCQQPLATASIASLPRSQKCAAAKG